MILLVGYLISDCVLNNLQCLCGHYQYIPKPFLTAFFFYRGSPGESLAGDFAFLLWLQQLLPDKLFHNGK